MKYIIIDDSRIMIEFDSKDDRDIFMSGSPAQDNWKKAADIMKECDITRPTLCHWAKSGKIMTKKVGGQYRYKMKTE